MVKREESEVEYTVKIPKTMLGDIEAIYNRGILHEDLRFLPMELDALFLIIWQATKQGYKPIIQRVVEDIEKGEQ